MVVAVVGGGLSGLVAGYRLVRAGVDVVVLEARSRMGGRAHRIDVGGHPFDAGCEAVDEGHEALLRLGAELGVRTWTAEPWSAHADEELEPLLRALEDELAGLVARIDPEHPEELEGAAVLDHETLAGWLAARGASDEELAAAELRYAVASSSVPTARMSLLAYAAKLAAGAAPTGLALRLEGGPTALADRLAGELGDAVRTGVEVETLEQSAAGVDLGRRGEAPLRADRAVLAVPLPLQRRLAFAPELPAHRRVALERAMYGAAVKIGFAYDEPPPVATTLSESGVLYQPDPRVPLLALFAAAGAAARASSFAPPGRPLASAAVDWSREPFSRGSYLIFGPGDLTSWGRRLAEPHGRIHFAGSEASSLPSYMEGAVRAGERAAAEILAAG